MITKKAIRVDQLVASIKTMDSYLIVAHPSMSIAPI